jgi:hypothetical protein
VEEVVVHEDKIIIRHILPVDRALCSPHPADAGPGVPPCGGSLAGCATLARCGGSAGRVRVGAWRLSGPLGPRFGASLRGGAGGAVRFFSSLFSFWGLVLWLFSLVSVALALCPLPGRVWSVGSWPRCWPPVVAWLWAAPPARMRSSVLLRPSPSTRACFCGAGSGSWASLALAAGLGLPVVVFWCASGPPSLPSWGGSWVLAGSGVWSSGWRFVPAARQLSLR